MLKNIKIKMPIVRTNFGNQKMEYQLNCLLNKVEEYADFSISFPTLTRVPRSFLVGNDVLFT